MSLFYLVGTLVAVVFLVWVANRYIPMDSRIKSILNVVVVVVVIYWLLNVLGIIDAIFGR